MYSTEHLFYSKQKNLKIVVNSVVLINEKRNHPNSIKDFSQIDLSTISRLRLPDYSSTNDELKFGSESTIKISKYVYLDIVSMDVNAFNDLSNLKSLHLRFGNPIKEIDLKQMTNLNEICLEYQIVFASDQEYLKSKLPKTLEKLSIIGFCLQLKSLKYLANLKFLELCKLEDLVISDSSHFNFFKHLAHLKIDDCSFSIKNSYGLDKKTIRFDLENLEELILCKIGHFDGRFHFNNLPKLKMLHVNSIKLTQIYLTSLKSLINLKDLKMRRNKDTGQIIHKYNCCSRLNDYSKILLEGISF